jgi:hypothetical protein
MLKDKSQNIVAESLGGHETNRFGTPSLVVLNARHLVLTSCVGSA